MLLPVKYLEIKWEWGLTDAKLFLCSRGSFLANVINADQHQIPYFTERFHCQTCHGWCGKIPRPSPFVFAYFKWLMTGVRKDLGARLGVVYRLFYVLTHPLFPSHFSILLSLILITFLKCFYWLVVFPRVILQSY